MFRSFLFVVMCVLGTVAANAAQTSSSSCYEATCPNSLTFNTSTMTGCTSIRGICFTDGNGNWAYRLTCDMCATGYTTSTSLSSSGASNGDGTFICTNVQPVSITSCKCVSGTTWNDVSGQNYQRNTEYCTSGNSHASAYRCKAGYYNTKGVAEGTAIPSCTQCTNYTWSSAGATACNTVDDGYYAVGCSYIAGRGGYTCTYKNKCESGYYCKNGVRNECPAPSSGAKVDSNDEASVNTDCYISTNATGSDTTGKFKYTSDCLY